MKFCNRIEKSKSYYGKVILEYTKYIMEKKVWKTKFEKHILKRDSKIQESVSKTQTQKCNPKYILSCNPHIFKIYREPFGHFGSMILLGGESNCQIFSVIIVFF